MKQEPTEEQLRVLLNVNAFGRASREQCRPFPELDVWKQCHEHGWLKTSCIHEIGDGEAWLTHEGLTVLLQNEKRYL